MLSKKAQITLLQGIIILTVFLIIFIVIFIIRVGQQAEHGAWKTECMTSVQSNVQWRKISSVFAEDIRCPTQDITIKEDLDTAKGQNTAKSHIIKSMEDCWEIYQKGNVDLFTDENTYCAICAIFDFEDKDKEITGLPARIIDYTGIINSNDIYSVIFIYAKGQEEIEGFDKTLETEIKSGKIAAYIGPHRDIKWSAAALFGEYSREGLTDIGCKAIPIKQ